MKLLITIAALLTFTAHPAFAREQFRGQYAQVDEQDRAWFRAQTSPKTGISCCSTADGIEAGEDIKDGHYWTRFVAHSFDGNPDIDSGWVEVPDDVVIHDPNRNGLPVVWWYFEGGIASRDKLRIRCYAPGSGV